MSIATMHSRPASAASRRAESGVDSAGLPATVMSARICPSPGVSISSARATTGSSPIVSGRDRTRVWCRCSLMGLPKRGVPRVFAEPTAAVVNIAPPGRSRLPVRTFRTSTSQDVMVPNSAVVVPMRPYTQADGAAASSRACRRMSAAAMPQAPSTASGVNGAQASIDDVEPRHEVVGRAERHEALLDDHLHHRHEEVGVGPGAHRHPLGGRLGGAGPAGVDDDELPAPLDELLEPAGPVRRGGQAAVRRERVGAEHEQVVGPVDVGDRHVERAAEHQGGGDLLGPLVDRRRREEVLRPQRPQDRPAGRAGRPGCGRWGCRRRRRSESRPWASSTGRRRASISAKASSQLTSTNSPSRFTSGRRSRSGSSWSCFSVEPFGQM